MKNIKIKNLLLFAMVTLLCGTQTHSDNTKIINAVGRKGKHLATVTVNDSQTELGKSKEIAAGTAIATVVTTAIGLPLWIWRQKRKERAAKKREEEKRKKKERAAKKREEEKRKKKEEKQKTKAEKQEKLVKSEQNKTATTQNTVHTKKVQDQGSQTDDISVQPTGAVKSGVKDGTKSEAEDGADMSLFGVVTDA